MTLWRDKNLYVVFAVTLMAILGVSSVTPAFPNIAEAFAISPQQVGLLISLFTVPGIALTPVIGVLADRYGRKTFLVPSLFGFAVAGTACGFVRDFELLLLLRFLQGVGASALGALNVTIIGDLYSGTRRAAAMGYNGSVLSVGTGAYPAIGGALAAVGWYVPFFLPILALPVGLLVLFVLENPEPEVERGFRAYLRAAVRLMRRGQVLTLFGASIVTFILIYGAYLAYLPFLLREQFGASSVTIGFTMTATSAATAVASFQLGRLAMRFGEQRLVRAGFLLYVTSVATMPLADSWWSLAVPLLLFGVANGINIPSIMTLLTGVAPAEFRGAFMAVNGMLLRLGQTLGPVVTGVAFDLAGLDGAFYVSAGIALGMVMILVVGLRDVRGET